LKRIEGAMTNQEIAQILTHISQILDIQGDNPFKIRAYIKASQTISGLTYPLASLDERSKIGKLPGIGEGIAKKITELLQTGKLQYYEDLKKSEFAPLTDFLDIPGMGPKHARLIYDELGINSVAALRRAAEEGKLRALPGLGEKAEKNILQAIQQVQKYKERSPLAFIYPRAQAILEQLKEIKEVQKVTVAGSLRRMRETIADVDILAASDHPEKVMESFVRLPQTAKVVAQGPTKSSITTKDGFQVDLRVVPLESFGAACHYFTGSKAHNIRIRSLGIEHGLKINEYGVFKEERRIAGKTEPEIFKSVDLPYIAPELREDQGEIEAAQEGNLPSLVETGDILGDLHVHTNWSDGNNTIEEMAQAARRRGYRYVAICDHSASLGIAHGLKRERLEKQIEEIEKVDRKLKGCKVLKGIEVDIKPNGELDLDRDVLERLDVVVASVHSKFTQGEAEMTRRIVRALENPNVHILAHPTGRIIGKREPYSVNLDTVIDACLANGKILELNAYPERLDLSDLNCRKAKEKGVKLAISTDAHRTEHLEWVTFGVATARRGWIEPQDVINTLPLSKLRKILHG
jgi:DNA polymerase (family 10)